MSRLLLHLCGFAAVVLPALLAVYQVESARHNAYLGPRVDYDAHVPAPDSLDAMYERLGYRSPEIRRGEPVPRAFLCGLPEDLTKIRDATDRKQAFISALLPLVLRANELIVEDRALIARLRDRLAEDRALSAPARQWLARLAKRYDAGGPAPQEIDFDRLLAHHDVVPASLALAQGAIESGWGTSRFARQGNAIYGQWTWDAEDAGILPRRREAGKTHRIKAFDCLIDSVRGYVNNLNSGGAYRDFRAMRSRLRESEQPVTGLALAGTLTRYSERGQAYVRDLRGIITGNRLVEFEQARLSIPERLAWSASAGETEAGA